MSQSTLRQLLTIFETAEEPLSLPQLARELDVSAARLEEMLQFWVRKGKLRIGESVTDCGRCGKRGACPFVLPMPRTYELVREEDDPGAQLLLTACRHLP